MDYQETHDQLERAEFNYNMTKEFPNLYSKLEIERIKQEFNMAWENTKDYMVANLYLFSEEGQKDIRRMLGR